MSEALFPSYPHGWVTIRRSAVWGGRLRWKDKWSTVCGLIVTLPHPLVFGVHWLLSQSNLPSILGFRRNPLMLNIQQPLQQNICLKAKPKALRDLESPSRWTQIVVGLPLMRVAPGCAPGNSSTILTHIEQSPTAVPFSSFVCLFPAPPTVDREISLDQDAEDWNLAVYQLCILR